MWEEFVEVFGRLLQIYEEFLQLSRRKRRAILAAQAPQIEKIARREQELIAAVHRLERRRESVQAAILAKAGVAPRRPKLADLLRCCGEENARRLRSAQARLRETIAELRTCNEGNSRLLRQALQFIHYNLNLLSEAQVQPIYAAGGRERVETIKRLEVKA